MAVYLGSRRICDCKNRVYYRLTGSDAGDSIVTIDGENVTVPANSTIEGICFDITEIVTNNLKEIYIYGDVSTKFCESSLPPNYTLEIIHVKYSGTKTIDGSELCRELHSLKKAEFVNFKPTSLYRCFNNCESLEIIDTSSWDLSNCTSLERFMIISGDYRNNVLKSIDVSKWDTSKVTTMTSMFQYCQALTELDVSNWDTSNVTDMSYMFNHCEALTELDVSNWDTSKVTTMMAMFQRVDSLEHIDLSNWNTGNVTDMGFMFGGAIVLKELDLSKWDTSKVTDMQCMFNRCYNLQELDLSNFVVDKVTCMYSMFELNGSPKPNDGVLKTLKLGDWNLNNVTTLTTIGIGEDNDYRNVFYGAIELSDVEGMISNLRFSLNLESNPLTRDSALIFINGVSDNPVVDSPTLTFSSETKELLTDDDIAIATNKGWTVA